MNEMVSYLDDFLETIVDQISFFSNFNNFSSKLIRLSLLCRSKSFNIERNDLSFNLDDV